MSDKVPDINVFNIMTDVTAKLLVEVYGKTLYTESQTQKVWTESNSELTSAQVSDPVAIPVYKTDEDGNPTTEVDYYESAPGNTQEQDEIVEGMNAVLDGDMSWESFFSKYFQEPYIYGLSSALCTTLLSELEQTWPDDDADGQTYTTQITQMNQWVTANAQQEEAGGQNEIKLESSQIQTTTGLPSNIQQLYSALVEIYGSINSALGNGITA